MNSEILFKNQFIIRAVGVKIIYRVVRWKNFVVGFSFLCIIIGTTAVAFSPIYDRSGIQAVEFYWGYPSHSRSIEVNLTSNESMHNIVIRACRVQAILNTSGAVISALLFNETGHLLANLSMVSGNRVGGLIWPQENPTGWVQPQNYTISLIWEGLNTTVLVDYWTYELMHGDSVVISFLPEYFVIIGFGNVMIIFGLMLLWIYQFYRLALTHTIESGSDQIRFLTTVGVMTGVIAFLVPFAIAGFPDPGYELVISAIAWSWRAESVFFSNQPLLWIVILPFILLEFVFIREVVLYRLHASSVKRVAGAGILNAISLFLVRFIILFAYPLAVVGRWWAYPLPVLLLVAVILTKIDQEIDIRNSGLKLNKSDSK